jgi:hypothetical protein
MNETITKEDVVKTLSKAKARAFARIAEFEDPLIPMDDAYVNSAEYQHLLTALEHDYCLFTAVVDWIEKYVPAFEESDVFSEYLAKKHAQVEAEQQPAPANVIDFKAWRGRHG